MGTSKRYNSVPVKYNCALFAPTPYFRTQAIRRCHLNFSPKDPCCHGNQPFLCKDKIGCRLTRVSNAGTQLLGYTAWQWDRYLVSQNVFLVLKYILLVKQKFIVTKKNQNGTFYGPLLILSA